MARAQRLCQMHRCARLTLPGPSPAQACVWHGAFSRCQMHRPSGPEQPPGPPRAQHPAGPRAARHLGEEPDVPRSRQVH